MNKLTELIDRFANNLDSYKSQNYSEAQCRLEFLDVLLQVLGWDVQNLKGLPPSQKEVIVELASDEGHHDKPDYTLTFFGVSKLFVEAKKPHVDITIEKEPALQCRRYGWNAGHPVSVLTNFEYLSIYDTSVPPTDSDTPDTALFKRYKYTEFIDKFSEISRLISKESLYSDIFKEWTSQISSRTSFHKPVDDAFFEQIDEWRVCIANQLFSANPVKYSDMDYLNSQIQLLISRIIFIRICEDREIYKYYELKNISSAGAVPKDEILKLFMEADAKFGAGLFADTSIVADLDDGLLTRIVRELYYPDVPYIFSVIKPHILGKIYEAYLSERLINNDGEISLAKKEEYKDRSIVTTPEDVVSLICRKTVTQRISTLNKEEILNQKFSDIACGSGIFLEAVYDSVVDRFIQLGFGTERDLDNNKKLPISLKKEIITNCIFGNDIDKQACEVTKFSLAIKVLEGETYSSIQSLTNLLPNIDDNILCFNSLVQRENITGTPSLTELVSINPSSFNFNESYDVILCNPPYVKTEDMHNLLCQREFDIYKRIYKSAYKQFDKYFLFVEKSLNLLKSDGVIGFIIPNKFLKNDTSKELRKLLADKCQLEIYDFGPAQLFEDKTIYSCLLFAKKSANHILEYKETTSLIDAIKGEFKNELSIEIQNNEWLTSKEFVCPNSEKFIKLTDILEPINGIQTSQERPNVYWFGENEIVSQDNEFFEISRDGNNYKIEKTICKKYFKPISNSEQSISSFDRLTTNKYIIFPYRMGRLYSIDEMEHYFPCCWEYLNDKKSILMPKQLDSSGHRDVPNATMDTWYQYGRTQNLTMFDNLKKLIVKNMFKDNPLFILDEDNMVISSGGTAGYSGLVLKENNNYSMRFIQAYLLSDLNLDIMKRIGSDFEGGFYSIGTSILKKLYIPKLDFSNQEDVRYHDWVVERIKRIEEIVAFINDHPTIPNKQVLINEKHMIESDVSQSFRRFLWN